jgi:uncharacterized protein (TIGR03118 family)
MLFHSWLQNIRSTVATRRRQHRKLRRSATNRPRLESLEDRTVPSGFQQTNLVGYQPGLGHFTDANLNGWGMTSMPDGSFCVANAFTTGLATFYDRSGHVLPQTISIPASAAHPFGPVGHPTGVVYNPTSDFVISEAGRSAPARLIFDTLDGAICGWNPAVDPTHAIVMVDNSTAAQPAFYTGLDLVENVHGRAVLYAADIGRNQVEMFDGSVNAIGTPFTDSAVTGLAAWQVESLNGKLYVTFANPFAPPAGPHGGVVDVFDFDGNLLTQFAANAPGAGPLENPWGITQAPAKFGEYRGDILIGNVAGDGNINAFDPMTGAYLGQLKQPNGAPIKITGLWDLEFGEGTPDSGKTNQLFFDAGPDAPGVSSHGLFGVIRAAGDPARSSLLGGGDLKVDESNLVEFSSSLRIVSPSVETLSKKSLAATTGASIDLQWMNRPIDDTSGTVQARRMSPDSRFEMLDPQFAALVSTFAGDRDGIETTIVQMSMPLS